MYTPPRESTCDLFLLCVVLYRGARRQAARELETQRFRFTGVKDEVNRLEVATTCASLPPRGMRRLQQKTDAPFFWGAVPFLVLARQSSVRGTHVACAR